MSDETEYKITKANDKNAIYSHPKEFELSVINELKAKCNVNSSEIKIKTKENKICESIEYLLNHFSQMSSEFQLFVLTEMLNKSQTRDLQFISNVILSKLKINFLSNLPFEVFFNIIKYFSIESLINCLFVCKSWRELIDMNGLVYSFHLQKFNESNLNRDSYIPRNYDTPLPPPHPIKDKFIYHYKLSHNWSNNKFKRLSFQCHDHSVVTCLLFIDEANGSVVTGSDDQSICVWNVHNGDRLMKLTGHEGGVWALQHFNGIDSDGHQRNILVSGSTDRTIKLWDLMNEGKCIATYSGHASTVRCLQIIEYPSEFEGYVDEATLVEKRNLFPLICTGSRDTTLKVWKLPKVVVDGQLVPVRTEIVGGIAEYHDTTLGSERLNPYFLHTLSSHENSVRSLSGYGFVVCSGSYDHTVRVWDIVHGRLVHELRGHIDKIYSVQFSPLRANAKQAHELPIYLSGICVSGSMDTFIRVWDCYSGTCLQILSGHQSLVGLLSLRGNVLISGAADATLRIWEFQPNFSPYKLLSCEENDKQTTIFKHRCTLNAQFGAITCFSGSGDKLVSGNDGNVKLWNIGSYLEGRRTLKKKKKSVQNVPTLMQIDSRPMTRSAARSMAMTTSTSFPSITATSIQSDYVENQENADPEPEYYGKHTGHVPSRFVNDLITGVSGIWRVFCCERWMIAAVQREGNGSEEGETWLEIMDFGV